MTSLTEEARQAMQERKYAVAIDLYDRHLERRPEDLRSLMEVGMCHLLNGSREIFLNICITMNAVIAKNGPLEGKNRELWDYYLSLVRKVTGTALVIGSVAVSGCKGDMDCPGGGKTGSGSTPSSSFSGHKYSGGVQMSPRPPVQQQENIQTEPQPDKSITQPPKTNAPISSHRYSGGVYMNKTRVSQEENKTDKQ